MYIQVQSLDDLRSIGSVESRIPDPRKIPKPSKSFNRKMAKAAKAKGASIARLPDFDLKERRNNFAIKTFGESLGFDLARAMDLSPTRLAEDLRRRGGTFLEEKWDFLVGTTARNLISSARNEYGFALDKIETLLKSKGSEILNDFVDGSDALKNLASSVGATSAFTAIAATMPAFALFWTLFSPFLEKPPDRHNADNMFVNSISALLLDGLMIHYGLSKKDAIRVRNITLPVVLIAFEPLRAEMIAFADRKIRDCNEETFSFRKSCPDQSDRLTRDKFFSGRDKLDPIAFQAANIAMGSLHLPSDIPPSAKELKAKDDAAKAQAAQSKYLQDVFARAMEIAKKHKASNPQQQKLLNLAKVRFDEQVHLTKGIARSSAISWLDGVARDLSDGAPWDEVLSLDRIAAAKARNRAKKKKPAPIFPAPMPDLNVEQAETLEQIKTRILNEILVVANAAGVKKSKLSSILMAVSESIDKADGSFAEKASVGMDAGKKAIEKALRGISTGAKVGIGVGVGVVVLVGFGAVLGRSR